MWKRQLMNEANLERKLGFKRNENVGKVKSRKQENRFLQKKEKSYVDITCTDLFGRPFRRGDLWAAASAAHHRHAVYGNHPGAACFGTSGR